MTADQSRPGVVTAAFWCWVLGSFLLVTGGLIAATWADAPLLSRGAGVISVFAGAGMAFLAGRSRGDDARFRRAGMALSLAIVVLISLSAALGVGNVITLLAGLPLIAGAALLTRPSASTQEERQ